MSSALILSLSTVFALIGIVLVSIAFGTNNWQEFKVDRTSLQQLSAQGDAAVKAQLARMGSSDLYFSRSFGLLRECFSSDVPSGEEWNTYLSPLGATCVNLKDFQIPEDQSVTERWNQPQRLRMHLMRATVAFYVVGLGFLFFCLFTGIVGCWRRSAGLVVATGILLLFATLFLAASMAVWHGVDYLSREVINTDTFYLNWPQVVKDFTKIDYGWSYMLSWIGIGFVLISSVLMLAAFRSMKDEEQTELEKKRGPFVSGYYDKQALMPYAYSGYGYGYPAAPYGYATYGGSQQQFAPYGYLTYSR